ncbi:probable endo-1,3(4)-beta-glucanase AO090023000083 [Drosophila obscura]|uniref:probable endo-1,3(4)-beta-glucanase AO090023000083 n=1 Tax=Drosophila obscura TaxID=7282 RepID=UPI001BB1BA05|nr:probable endo-1,3(4)-beta-glucanase AO090023000083 [Drosophila obscura]
MLLVFFDAFNKWVELVPLRKATTAQLEKAFRERILSRFGVPRRFVCDNGTQFTSRSLRDFCKLAGMELDHTAPYTPQQNPTERANRTIKTMIAQYIDGDQRTWDDLLPELSLAINSSNSDPPQTAPQNTAEAPGTPWMKAVQAFQAIQDARNRERAEAGGEHDTSSEAEGSEDDSEEEPEVLSSEAERSEDDSEEPEVMSSQSEERESGVSEGDSSSQASYEPRTPSYSPTGGQSPEPLSSEPRSGTASPEPRGDRRRWDTPTPEPEAPEEPTRAPSTEPVIISDDETEETDAPGLSASADEGDTSLELDEEIADGLMAAYEELPTLDAVQAEQDWTVAPEGWRVETPVEWGGVESIAAKSHRQRNPTTRPGRATVPNAGELCGTTFPHIH